VGFVAWDVYDLVTTPSWARVGVLGADVGLAAVPFVPAGVGAAGRAARAGAHAAEAARGAHSACEVATEMHHAVPKAVLKELRPEVAKAVRGKRGAPNRIRIPRSFHRAIHSGGPAGGAYNRFWLSRLDMLEGGPVGATVGDVLRIREDAIGRFGLMEHLP